MSGTKQKKARKQKTELVPSARGDSELQRLVDCANLANREAVEGVAGGIRRFRDAGEALAGAKERVGHGMWTRFVKENYDFGLREAQRYMQAFRDWDAIEPTLTAADCGLRLLASPKGPKATPVSLLDPPRPPAPGDDSPPCEGPEGEASRGEDAPPTEDSPAPPTPAVNGPAPKAPTRDELGIPIQPHAAAAFAELPKVRALLAKMRECERDFGELVEGPAGAHLMKHAQWVRLAPAPDKSERGKWTLSHLGNALAVVESCRPSVTDCPFAHNEHRPHPEECKLCHNARWCGPLKNAQVPPGMLGRMREHYGVSEGAADV